MNSLFRIITKFVATSHTRNIKKRHTQMLDAIKSQVEEGTKMIPNGTQLLKAHDANEAIEKLHRERQEDLERQ